MTSSRSNTQLNRERQRFVNRGVQVPLGHLVAVKEVEDDPVSEKGETVPGEDEYDCTNPEPLQYNHTEETRFLESSFKNLSH